jgi:NitT/TauT family transport system substrate-binding protein
MRRTLLAVAPLVLLALGCGGQASSAPPSAPTSVAAATAAVSPGRPGDATPERVAMRFGLNTNGPSVAPAWIAKDEGFFEKYGIDAELVVLQSSAQLAPALISGEVPLATTAATGIVSSALAGSDLVLLGSFTNRLVFWFWGRPEITAISDLRGKQVGITRRGGAIDLATKIVLERHGLDPDRDVVRMQLGSSQSSIAALLSGAVSATMVGMDGFIARLDDQGMRMMVDFGDYDYPLVLQAIAGSPAWVAQHEDLTRRTLQAIAEGVAFAHQHKDRTKAILGKYTQTEDAEILEKIYRALVPQFERTLLVPPEALRGDLEALVEEVPTARGARPEQFVDHRFVEELERRGFFRQLYP